MNGGNEFSNLFWAHRLNEQSGGRCSSSAAEDAAVAAGSGVGGGGGGGADSHASDALSLLDALGGESLPEKERRLSQEIAKLQKLRQQLLAQHATAANSDYTTVDITNQRVSQKYNSTSTGNCLNSQLQMKISIQ